MVIYATVPVRRIAGVFEVDGAAAELYSGRVELNLRRPLVVSGAETTESVG
jgi:hypothetical protein